MSIHRARIVSAGIATLALTFSVGLSLAETQSGRTEKSDQTAALIAGYRQWRLVTPNPVYVPDQIASLCSSPLPARRAKLDQGPHTATFINVYVNKFGRRAMTSRKPGHFPAGSVIVKEKHRSEHGPIELLTVMVKGAAGSHPSTGDWQYAIADADGRTFGQSHDVARCESCHQRVQSRDYVFRTYMKDRPS